MTNKEAYLAMISFLEKHYERTQANDIGGLLGDLMLVDEEETADPAAWQDWLEAVNKVTSV